MEWTTACPDWEQRIVHGRSLIPCEPLFADEAEAALAVFKSLRVYDIPGSPTLGEVCTDWVFDLVRVIFGSYDPNLGKRLINEFMLLIAKKNGKSLIAAGIMVTALVRNWRNGAELLILAPTKEVADNSYKPASFMIRLDPELSNLISVHDNLKMLTHRVTHANMKVVAADTTTVAGKKASFVFIDELWEFGKRANADSMLMEATGGQTARPEGFTIYASTHSDEPPTGVFKDKLELFRSIRDGEISNPRSLGVLYEFPQRYLKEELYLDPANWYITNPNLGRSASADFIEKQLLESSGDAAKRRIVLAKFLNVEIGMALRKDRWRGAEYWERNADVELALLYRDDPFKALQRLIDRCECITIGADGGGLDDIFGLTILGREPKLIDIEFEVFGRKVKQSVKRWLSWSHGWCHEGVLEIRKSIATKLKEFEAAKELTIVGDELIDLVSIVELIKMVKDQGKLGGVGVDPAGLGEMVNLLADIDVTEENELLRGVQQGFAMMNAIKTCERQLARGLIKHCGGVMMPWTVANLKIEPTATAIRATKQNAGDAKIDPAMALFDAASVMVRNPVPYRGKKYEIFVIA